MRGLFLRQAAGEVMGAAWHQDRAIAVKQNRLPGTVSASRRRIRSATCRVAPWLSRQIVLVRIHLDAMVAENGPLQVCWVPHREETENSQHQEVKLFAQPGMCCDESAAVSSQWGIGAGMSGCIEGILHLGVYGVPGLPDGYEWHTFVPGVE